MTTTEYFAHKAVSKSSLDDFARCPAYYHAAHIARTVKRETTPAMQFGTLLHGLVLEGRADYHVKPDGMTFASKDGKAWKEAHGDKPILSADAAAELQAMASAILRHPHAAPLFGKGYAELAMFGTHKETGLAIKGRADWLGVADFGKHRLVDIKTTISASNADFSRTIAKYRYHCQAYLYCELARQNGYQVDDFYFIAIEKGDVPLINVRVLSQAAIDLGKITLDAQLRELKACLDNDFWPDYSGADTAPGVIDLPIWAYSDTAGCELIDLDETEIKTAESISETGDLIP